MAGSAVTILLAFVLFPHGSIANTLNSEKESVSVVRRESRAVHIDSQGEIVHAARSHGLAQKASTSKENSFCNNDYVLGVDDSNDCTDTSLENSTGKPKQVLVTSKEMCIQAAIDSGAITDHFKFDVTDVVSQKKHPKFCFKDSCPDGVTGICYYYNPVELVNAGAITGTPICSRDRFVYGTKDKDNECPDDYTVIEDGEMCRSAAACESVAPGGDFHIGLNNGSKHLDYPTGCYKSDTDNHVYFNEETEMGLAATPKGIPMCNVTSPLHWGAGQTDEFVEPVTSGNSTTGNGTSL